MNERYFNLKIGKPNVNGEIIQVNQNASLENRLTDFINSNVGEENNLQFELIKNQSKGAYYKIKVPEMKLDSGGYITCLNINCGPGWVKVGEDIADVILTPDFQLIPKKPKTKKGERVYIQEITKQKAKSMKEDEFYYNMSVLYVLGY